MSKSPLSQLFTASTTDHKETFGAAGVAAATANLPALVSGATASNADHEETFEVFLSNFERGTVKRGMMEVDMEPRYNLRSKLWTLYLSCQFNIKCVAFSDN